MAAEQPDLVRRELAGRIEYHKRRYNKDPDETHHGYDVGVYSLILGRPEESKGWFARAAAKGSISYALLSQVPEAIEAAKRKPQSIAPTELLRRLARGEDQEGRGLLQEIKDEDFRDMALGLMESDADRFARGLNETLKAHKRTTGRNRSNFNSAHGFMSQHGSVWSVLATQRDLPVHIDKKYCPAKVQILFTEVKDLENPPSHIQVDLVPEIYRTPVGETSR